MNKHLIIYVKKPEAGHSKTRLGAQIGYNQAAGVYARLLHTYLGDLLHSDSLNGTAITLAGADKKSAAYFKAAYPEFRFAEQIKGGLGDRMLASFEEAFALGADAAILTGSDIPLLNARLISTAFSKLRENDVVLGPAEDGGYYLIGMQKPGWNVFKDNSWSTDAVLEKTMDHLLKKNLKYAFLPEGFDIDFEADYRRWLFTLNSMNSGGSDG